MRYLERPKPSETLWSLYGLLCRCQFSVVAWQIRCPCRVVVVGSVRVRMDDHLIRQPRVLSLAGSRQTHVHSRCLHELRSADLACLQQHVVLDEVRGHGHPLRGGFGLREKRSAREDAGWRFLNVEFARFAARDFGSQQRQQSAAIHDSKLRALGDSEGFLQSPHIPARSRSEGLAVSQVNPVTRSRWMTDGRSEQNG